MKKRIVLKIAAKYLFAERHCGQCNNCPNNNYVL